MIARPDTPDDLWSEYFASGRALAPRNRLVEQYLPLVRKIAERVGSNLPGCVELADLVAEGTFGLLRAIASFDPARRVKFETYSQLPIRGAMLDSLRAADWMPRTRRATANAIQRARRAFEVERGRAPADAELARRLKVSRADLESALRSTRAVGVVSLSKQWRGTDAHKDIRVADVLADRRAPSPSRRGESRDRLRMLCKGLNRAERLLVILYYYEDRTMKEVGESLGLSESRVSQMHAAILGRLRSQLPERPEFADEIAGLRRLEA